MMIRCRVSSVTPLAKLGVVGVNLIEVGPVAGVAVPTAFVALYVRPGVVALYPEGKLFDVTLSPVE